MMPSRFLILFCVAMYLCCPCIYARTIRDTLVTTDGDKIIVSYELARSGNQYTIKFNSAQKKLGKINEDKYPDPTKVVVMFFDRTGGFSNNVSITNMVPEAFMVPSYVTYEQSNSGYFVLGDTPTLIFSSERGTDLTIPLYLAYHSRKGRYALFSKCKGLKIEFVSSVVRHQESNNVTQTSVTTSSDAANEGASKALESVIVAKDLLSRADKLPFSESLQDEIRFLRLQKREISDPDVLYRISNVLEMYEEKKDELEKEARDAQIAAQREAEAIAQREAAELQAKNDALIAAQQEQAEKEKQRNKWMVIGGILLSILMFSGNQLIQSLRNSRNQKNMMGLQQNIADKAEAEAKRRARSAIRNTTNRTVGQAKAEARDVVRKKTTIKINGKSKNLSI